MSEWKEYILENVIDKFIDYRGKTPTKTTYGIPLVTAKIVKNGRLLEPNEFIAEEDYESWMTRGYPEINDVILTSEAPLGEVALIKNKRIALAQRIITLQTKKDLCDSIFLKYYFQSTEGQASLQSRASGSTVEGIKAAELKKLEISLPPLPEQTAIASILSSLDDKIDLLHRQNATLEKMAETLFRQWFVEEAKEEWEDGKLSDLVVVKYGKDHKKLLDGNIPVYGSGGLMRHAEKSLYDKESVLIPRKGTLNNVMYQDEPFWTVDTMFYTEMKIPNVAKFVYHFVKEQDLAAMNVGSAVPSMTTEILNNMPLDLPPNEVFERFEKAVSPLYSKIKSNQTQIRTLTALQDTLLPKLMSGELRVKI
jgi:type I restriction enzyme, S subunit